MAGHKLLVTGPDGSEDLIAYGFDGTFYEATPPLVVLPETTAQVRAVHRIATARRIPITPRARNARPHHRMIPFESPPPVCTIEHAASQGTWESTEAFSAFSWSLLSPGANGHPATAAGLDDGFDRRLEAWTVQRDVHHRMVFQ